MLLRNHGASTLGKKFRRSIITTMTSFDGTTTLSWNAMRSSFPTFSDGRYISNNSRSNTTREQKFWSPNHGIVFASSPDDTRRLIGTIATADPILQPNVQDGHVMAGTEKEGVEGVAVVVADQLTETCSKELEAEPEDQEQYELPQTTSSFTMPEEIFRAAKNSVPGSADSFWTHTLYRGPEQDGVEPKVKVHYCRSKHTTEQTLQKYFADKKVLGFDIEWQPETHKNSGAKKNVSLVQLASEDRIGLFHIALYPKDNVDDLVAPLLRKIMEDASVTKVGVAIKADCTRLRKYLKIESRGIFELSHLYKLVKFSSSRDFKLINKRLVSLSTQVQEHLHLPMYKGGDVRSSDWSQPLQMDQIVYAASDSYAGLHLFDTMEIKREALDPTPPRPYHAEENKPIRLAEGGEIPTDEELEPEEHEPISAKKTYSKRPTSYFRDVSVEIDNLDPEFSIFIPPSTTTMPTTRSKTTTPKAAPRSPLITAATALTDEYRVSHPNNKATPSSLRCYFLWYHNPELSLPDIAALLRETPLQTATVVNYILESVRAEKLPFGKERLRDVLGELPRQVAAGRYKTLIRACEAEGVGKGKEDE